MHIPVHIANKNQIKMPFVPHKINSVYVFSSEWYSYTVKDIEITGGCCYQMVIFAESQKKEVIKENLRLRVERKFHENVEQARRKIRASYKTKDKT